MIFKITDPNGKEVFSIESDNPIKSEEGMINYFKQHNAFFREWTNIIAPVVAKSEKERGVKENNIELMVNKYQQRDYNEFITAYKKNKNIVVKAYVNNIKQKYLPQKPKDPKDLLKEYKANPDYSHYSKTISDIAKATYQMWTKTVQNVKTSNEVKTVQKICPNYLKYLYDVPSIEEIENEMYDHIKRGYIESVDDVRYVAYVFDMEGFREEYPDSYEENPNLQEGLIYDALYNCIPNYSGKYYFEQNCYGWSSVTFGIYAT